MDGRTLMAECFSSDKAAMSAAKVGNIRLPLEKLEEEGKIFVIRPRMKAIGRMEQDRKKLAAFYVDGYRLMGEQYAALCKYLEK